MKKFFEKMHAQVNAAAAGGAARVRKYAVGARRKLAGDSGQFVMDHAVVFVIILVIAAIVIALLTTFLQSDMAPLMKQKILDFFN